MALGIGKYIKFSFPLPHGNGILEGKGGGVNLSEFLQSIQTDISFGLAVQNLAMDDESQALMNVDNHPLLTDLGDHFPESFQGSFPHFQDSKVRLDELPQDGSGFIRCKGKTLPKKKEGQERGKNHRLYHVPHLNKPPGAIIAYPFR